MTLLRLKHNLSYSLLSVLFKIGKKTSQRYFESTLEQLYEIMINYIQIPDYETRKSYYFNVGVERNYCLILDGFEQEILSAIYKPLNNFTFSGKKYKHTLTKLIGVSKEGFI